MRPKPLPEELKLVYRAIASQRYGEARELARSYLKDHPGQGQATFMIGLSYFKSDNHGAAKPFFEEALELDPDYYIIHEYLGESLFLLGDMPGARRAYEAFGAVAATEPKAHVRLGMIDVEEGHPQEAHARYRRALELFEELRKRDPRTYRGRRSELAAIHARIGDLLFAADDYAAAREELLQATHLGPQNISALFTLSLVYRRLGEDALAEQAASQYEAARQAITDRMGSTQR